MWWNAQKAEREKVNDDNHHAPYYMATQPPPPTFSRHCQAKACNARPLIFFTLSTFKPLNLAVFSLIFGSIFS